MLLKAITILYDGAMKTLVTLLLACCFDGAMAQSNLPACLGTDATLWTACYGRQTFSNGDSYIGEYRYGRYHGKGSYGYGNGETYAGEWEDGLRKGLGVYSFVNGDMYAGEFDVKANGQGIYTYANGDKYVGEIEDDQFHGQGVTITADGKVAASGIWKKSKLVEAKFVDVTLFARIPNPSKFIPNFAQLTKNETQAKQIEVEPETQLGANQEPSRLQKHIPPQGKRVALVIGNSKYKFNPLNNPVNDATDMAASLRSVGFDVIEVKNATLKQMREATRRFADKLEVSDVGLVYYSGHGIEVKGTNYLIPVNADIRREYEVVDQAFDASNLLRMMESLQGSVKKRVNILIVDACRNNDLPKSWRSSNNGLARMDAPAGSFISFATAPGQVASDGNGRNSPYTKHLLNALKQPNVPIEQVFKQVRRNVMDETGGEQVPWENSSLIGDFYFTVAR